MHFCYFSLWNEKQQNYTWFLYFNFTFVFFIHKKHITFVEKFALSLLSVLMLCLSNLAILIMLPSNSWSDGCSIDVSRHYLGSFFFFFVQTSFAEVVCNLTILLLLKFSYDKFSKYCSFPQYALGQFISIKEWIITDLI